MSSTRVSFRLNDDNQTFTIILRGPVTCNEIYTAHQDFMCEAENMDKEIGIRAYGIDTTYHFADDWALDGKPSDFQKLVIVPRDKL